MTKRLLQRQILPADRELEVMSLYVDPDPAAASGEMFDAGNDRQARITQSLAERVASANRHFLHPDQIGDRTSVVVRPRQRLSFGTYFNAFPASYWRRWTVVSAVTLAIRVRGYGATVTVYRSQASGRLQRVESATTTSGETSVFEFELSLVPFADGGWYWYDVMAGDEDAVVESAEWTAEVPEDRVAPGNVTIGITTMNRPDFCADLLGQMADDEQLRPYLDEVLVVDQGSQKVVDSPKFAKVEAALGGLLRVIEQDNLGGSGGYARGQLETVRKGTSTYFMCMDDDVVCEPEGIIRAVTFGDLARRPTIVGGHMFSLYAKSRLHSFGEIVQPWRFWWTAAPGVVTDWDFGAVNLRSAPWLHRRVDVDYNGWFMCLIPTEVLRDVGLSLPLFIKWDDSEYGLRARAAGYPTVTLPGAAVWHVPWTDKNDALDWQSYFHQRNRFVAALLHSPFEHGGRMVRESFNHQLKHLMSMQYSTAVLRLRALEDVLAGPGELHGVLDSKLGEVRALAAAFTDARNEKDPDAFPPAKVRKPRKRDGIGEAPGHVSQVLTALSGTVRQLRAPRPLSREFPERYVAARDARWYKLAKLDSAVVSMPDGTSAALYRRDPERFRDLMARSLAVHQRLLWEWPELARRYRKSLDEIASADTWEKTLLGAPQMSDDGVPGAGVGGG
jgi:galactofuranosylgalactofuranosylrhamnosyl-N-acetylglucosaminyl-diphospho-decaprenol beta-1,5/1,6-galactofuranosyltransferase